MGKDSAIEWTHHTHNIVWGCQRVSEGCTHCYAETMAKRYGYNVWGPAKTTERRTMSARYWEQPLRWNDAACRAQERRRVFCGSMSDIFEDHPTNERERERLWPLIERTPMLDWLLLTKRPQDITSHIPIKWRFHDGAPHNVWYGTSCEDQQRADERIPELLKVPARVRFLSCEPLLGAVDLSQWLPDLNIPIDQGPYDGDAPIGIYDPLTREYYPDPAEIGIHWVIAGGESGPGARPMWPSWARELRDQCQAAGVAFFMKQWGEYEPYEEDGQPPFWNDQHGRMYDGHGLNVLNPETSEVSPGWHEDSLHSPYAFRRVGKHRAGRLLDGRTWDEFPNAIDTAAVS